MRQSKHPWGYKLNIRSYNDCSSASHLVVPVVYFLGKIFGILHYLETGGHSVSSVHLDIA